MCEQNTLDAQGKIFLRCLQGIVIWSDVAMRCHDHFLLPLMIMLGHWVMDETWQNQFFSEIKYISI